MPSTFQQHQLLFSKDHFDNFNPNPDSNVVGTYMFSNPTRVQVKDLKTQKCDNEKD
jgi:hypothetical protein